MKNLKIALLIFFIGFGSTVSATLNIVLSSTIGPQILFKSKSAKIASLDVVGDYEYYLRYNNYRLNYKKIQDQREVNKEDLLPSCAVAIKAKETCIKKTVQKVLLGIVFQDLTLSKWIRVKYLYALA